MPNTNEDKFLIKSLLTSRVYSKGSNVGNVCKLLQKLQATGSVVSAGSGRWCSDLIADNIDLVYQVVLHKNI